MLILWLSAALLAFSSQGINAKGVPPNPPGGKPVVVQREFSTDFEVNFTAPDFKEDLPKPMKYDLTVSDVSAKEERQNINGMVTGLSMSVTVPMSGFSLKVGGEYIFSVKLCYDDECSSAAISEPVAFKGPAPPQYVNLTKRLSTALVFEIIPYVDSPNLFYVVNGKKDKPLDNTTFAMTGLEPYTNVSVSVAVCVGEKKEPFCSSTTSVDATTNVAEPSAVLDFGGLVKDNKPMLNWKAPEKPNGPLDGFQLEWFQAGKEEDKPVIKDLAPDATSYMLKEAINCRTYKVALRAFNFDLNENTTKVLGPATNLLELTTEGNCSVTVNTPISFKFTRVTPQSNILSWEWVANDGIDISNIEFKVEYCLDGNDCLSRTVDAAFNVTLEKLKPKSRYDVNLTAAIKHHEDVDPSEPLFVEMTTLVEEPAAVGNLNGNLTNNKPILTWESPEGEIEGFQVESVEVGKDNSKTPPKDLASNETKYEYSEALNCKTYNFTVQAFTFNLHDNTTKVLGVPSTTAVKTAGDCSAAAPAGFPVWAIILIVIVVLAAVGGGAYYFLKMR